jgi:DNA-binding transcriptional LysR family regulator
MNARVHLDLNDVALLVRVVQTRSFTAAARERGVPVSTVSRRIARLESALGTRLLERTTRRLSLTDEGRRYFAHAERAVEDLARGTDRVRELQNEPHGRLRILAPLTLGAPVANVLYTYLAKYPGVSVDLELADRHRRGDLLADERGARRAKWPTSCATPASRLARPRGLPRGRSGKADANSGSRSRRASM